VPIRSGSHCVGYGFFYEFQLIAVQLVDSQFFPWWRHQTWSGFPDWLIEWLLYGTSAQKGYWCQETLLNQIWSRFVDKYNCIWRNVDWPASWHISTKSYQWRWKCGCSLTSPSPGVFNGISQLGHPQTVIIRRETMSAILGTVMANYFRFAAAILKISQNPLAQPQTIEIRRRNTSVTLGHHFLSAATNVKNGQYWLEQSQEVQIQRGMTSTAPYRYLTHRETFKSASATFDNVYQ